MVALIQIFFFAFNSIFCPFSVVHLIQNKINRLRKSKWNKIRACSYGSRAGPLSETAVSEISLCSYYYSKNYRAFIWRAGPVAEISLERGEISLIGIEISPYKHSQAG
jgi:hypothetical protein